MVRSRRLAAVFGAVCAAAALTIFPSTASAADVLRNEVLNPSFETGTARWSPWGGAQLSRVNGSGRYGSYSARLVGTAGGNWLAFTDRASGADVFPGDRVLLRASIRRAAGPEPMNVLLVARWYNAFGSHVGGAVVVRRVGTTLGAWHDLAGEISVPLGVSYASVQLQFTSAVVGNDFRFDGAQAIRLASGQGAPSYLDGSMANARWEGTAHDSRTFEVSSVTPPPPPPPPPPPHRPRLPRLPRRRAPRS